MYTWLHVDTCKHRQNQMWHIQLRVILPFMKKIKSIKSNTWKWHYVEIMYVQSPSQREITWDRKNEVTCILDILNLYIWMEFICYSCNIPSIIEKSETSVSFKVETWYLDMGMTMLRFCIRWILMAYRRSKVKHDVIYD